MRGTLAHRHARGVKEVPTDRTGSSRPLRRVTNPEGVTRGDESIFFAKTFNTMRDAYRSSPKVSVKLMAKCNLRGRRHAKVSVRGAERRVGDLVKRKLDDREFIVIESGDVVRLQSMSQRLYLSDVEYRKNFYRPGNTFTVYCSTSQQTWRFCSMRGEYYEKGRHYTSTTVVHPDRQGKLDRE